MEHREYPPLGLKRDPDPPLNQGPVTARVWLFN